MPEQFPKEHARQIALRISTHVKGLLLIHSARQLLTLQGPPQPRRGVDLRELCIIPDGAVLVRDGLIREVGTTRRIENLVESRRATEVDASGRVVMPGFVDSHAHLVSGPVRFDDSGQGLSFDPGGAGLLTASRRFLETHAAKVLADCIRNGTTTLEAKSGLGGTEQSELKTLRVQSAVGRRNVSVVSTFLAPAPANEAEVPRQMEWLCSRMLPLIKERKLAEFAAIACEPGKYNLEQSATYMDAALRLGLDLKLHTGLHGPTQAIPMALERKVRSIEHLVHITEKDVMLLARSNTIATLLPVSSFHMGQQRYAPARLLIDCGAAIALGSNYHPFLTPSRNMTGVVALACRHLGMQPAEAITAATINAAHAVNRADRTGSIEFGKYADILVLDVSDYREIPHQFGGHLVDKTIKSGQILYEKSEVKCLAN